MMRGIQHWVTICLERDTVVRSLKTGLVVGTVLGLINHWQNLLPWHVTGEEALQIGLTYLVPYGVATYGQVSGKLQREAASESLPPPVHEQS